MRSLSLAGDGGHTSWAKKKEASAGSGGTALSALAGGGNQSLLTVVLEEDWGIVFLEDYKKRSPSVSFQLGVCPNTAPIQRDNITKFAVCQVFFCLSPRRRGA